MAWKHWEDYSPPAVVGTARQVPTTPKRHKFGAVPHWVLPDLTLVPVTPKTPRPHAGALRFHSKVEAERFVALRLEQAAGHITGLTLQKQYALHVVTPEGVKVMIGSYLSDFSYARNGLDIVEDVKGADGLTLYKWKIAHLRAEYNIEVVEVR